MILKMTNPQSSAVSHFYLLPSKTSSSESSTAPVTFKARFEDFALKALLPAHDVIV